MSYIRNSQDSEYIDLGEGSREYLYNNGHSISGNGVSMDYGDWIGSLVTHASMAGFGDDEVDELERSLENYYGVSRNDVQAIGPRPEMAHVVAQHLDSRLDSLELSEGQLRKLQQYAEQSFAECPECGERWRPSPYITDAQGDLCRDCWGEELRAMDVSCDTSEMVRYVNDELPEDAPPTETMDDEFYALTMEAFMDREGDERSALAYQLGEAADEIQDALLDERPVNKESMLLILEGVSNE